MYSPVALIVPTALLPPATPSTSQLAPRFCESPVTVAVNCCGCVEVTAARLGLALTLMPVAAAVIVTIEDPDFVVSVIDVATTTLVAGFGTDVGAVYVTDVVVMLLSVPHAFPAHPASDQVTP